MATAAGLISPGLVSLVKRAQQLRNEMEENKVITIGSYDFNTFPRKNGEFSLINASKVAWLRGQNLPIKDHHLLNVPCRHNEWHTSMYVHLSLKIIQLLAFWTVIMWIRNFLHILTSLSPKDFFCLVRFYPTLQKTCLDPNDAILSWLSNRKSVKGRHFL